MILSPSMLSADITNLNQELKDLENGGVEWLHWDVMDGMFVPNITFGQHLIAQCRKHSKLYFDVHLMIEQPERYIKAFKEAGADILVVHQEATKHLQRTLVAIREEGMKAGVSLNPATPLEVLDYVLDDVDMILLMSVNPGFGGQSFIPATYDKIRKLKEKIQDRDILIQVDGGVSPENIKALTEAGANVFVSGSAFFKTKPYKTSLEAFNNALL